MSLRSFLLSDELFDYVVRSSVRETPQQRHLRERTAQMPNARMQTGADQLQFLQFLVTMLGARTTLEIGVFTGASALAVALALPAGGRIVACDVSEEYPRIGKPFWEEAGVASKIDLRIAPAVRTLDDLLRAGQSDSFDFAYIDADKSSYDAYYERALRLLRRGGVAAIDNVLWGGSVADSKETDPDTVALRTLNAKIRNDERVDACMLSIGDGLTLVRKR